MRFKLIGLILLIAAQNGWAKIDIQRWETPQGSRVYFLPTNGLPMVDIRITFDAGSARDGAQFGVAALTCALLDTVAGDMNADQIAANFESVGAGFSAGVSEDTAWLSLRSLSDPALLGKALATYQTILGRPAFNEADFQREKSRDIAGLKHREESPAETAAIAFGKAL